ncbi:MAG TPA: hypothetical protein VGJ66_07555, partial [Pyrinomonadaceae bacterium]
AEPCAVAPDAKVNFKHLPSGSIRTSEGWKLIGAACNKVSSANPRTITALKLTLASGATALGSA